MDADVAEITGANSALRVAGPTTVSADVLATMLTTPCTHPAHRDPEERFYLDHLLPIVVDGAAVDVCYRCFKDHEIKQPGDPKAEVR